MKDKGLKLKTGHAFHYDGQKYEGGKKSGVIPQDVVDRIKKQNEATSKKNGKLKKGDDGYLPLIDLKKHEFVEPKTEESESK